MSKQSFYMQTVMGQARDVNRQKELKQPVALLRALTVKPLEHYIS